MTAGGTVTSRDVDEAMTSTGLTMTSAILHKCTAMASNYKLTGTQLAESWEAHSLNRNVPTLNESTFPAYRNALLKDIEDMNTVTGDASISGDNGLVAFRPGIGKRTAPNYVTPPPPSKRPTKGKMSDISAVDTLTTGPSSTTQPSSPTRVLSSTPSSPGGPLITPPKVVSPLSSTTTPAPVVVPISRRYSSRTNADEIVSIYNPHNLSIVPSVVENTAQTDTVKPRYAIVQPDHFPHPRRKYRDMCNPLPERSSALQARLQNASDYISEYWKLQASEDDDHEHGDKDDDESKGNSIAPLRDVGIGSQNVMTCLGRICNEAHTGRLNPTSVLLEGSRHGSGGCRINLDFSKFTNDSKNDNSVSTAADTGSFSVFSGQIVAVEGMNPTGRKLNVHRICEGAPLTSSKTSAENLMKYHYGEKFQDGKKMKVMTVAGPYTTVEDLDYDPLSDLMGVVRDERPDVVVMMGPFVDLRHPLLKDGEVTMEVMEQGENGESEGRRVHVTFETLFYNKVALEIDDLLREGGDWGAQFVLVPSLDDAVAESTYPQAPLADSLPADEHFLKLPGAEGIEFGSLGIQHIGEGGTSGRVHCVSNPCTIKINEVVIGITSTDVLLHMSMDETNAKLPPGSRIERLCQHFLQQRSYYPIFPPPSLPGMETNLDLSKMSMWNMPCQPDILILPSKLTTFTKNILNKTVVTNPGHLVRGVMGGTYGIMEVHPMKRDKLESMLGGDIEMDHALQDRITVQIRRI